MGKGIEAKRGRAATAISAVSAAGLAVLICFFSVIPVKADIVDPDHMSIKSIHIAHNIVESGDFLIVFHYELYWDNATQQPNTTADENFLFRLVNSNETEVLGLTTPYPYVYSGYGEGSASMYWNASDAPAWGATYILRFEENIGVDPDPKIVKTAVGSDYYSPFNGTDDNRDWMTDYIIELALDLEQAWDAPGALITTGNYLTTAGETYFSKTIPGLKLMCPELFSIQPIAPDANYTNWTHAQQEAYQSQWVNGTWVATSLEGLSDLFGGASWHLLTGIGVASISLAVLALSWFFFRSTKPGLLLASLPLIAGSMLGFISMVIVGLIAFGAAMFLAYTFFLKGAS